MPSPQEAMLKALQKSVEEEEQVWKARVSAAEEELQKVRGSPISPGPTFPRSPNFTPSECHTIQGERPRGHLGHLGVRFAGFW